MNRSWTAALTLSLLCGMATLGAPEPADAQSAKARPVGVKIDGNIEYPQLSPDGTQIAYEVNFPAEKRRELYIVGWDGRATTGAAMKLVPESMDAPSRYGASKRVTHGFAWANKGQYAYAYTVSDSSRTRTPPGIRTSRASSSRPGAPATATSTSGTPGSRCS